jgi:hypothetical protein
LVALAAFSPLLQEVASLYKPTLQARPAVMITGLALICTFLRKFELFHYMDMKLPLKLSLTRGGAFEV